MTLVLGTDQTEVLHIQTTADIVDAFGGDDWIVMYEGAHQIWGGAGSDTISFVAYNGSVHVDLRIPGWQETGRGGIQLSDIENVVGSNFTDRLIGNDGVNSFAAWGGDDVVCALGGNDRIRAGLGNDTFDGGTGRDTASFASTESIGLKVDLRNTGWQNTNEGWDKFISIENLFGSQKNDRFIGNSYSNIIEGNEGNDRLDGWNGSDTLWGGYGNDVFVWNTFNTGRDTIRDFVRGQDKIDVNFTSAHAGANFNDLKFSYGTSSTVITFDGDVDMRIVLSGTTKLYASDFIF